MPFQISPGVNVTEIDLTTVVPAVSTTEAGIAGQFRWGPLNQRVLIESEDELVKRFWKPNNDVANDWFTAANFLSYGNKLWTVRVGDQNNANTDLRPKNATVSNSSGFLVKNDNDYENNYDTGNLGSTYTTGPWIAKYPGSMGNSLKVSFCPSANAFESTLSGNIAITSNTTTVTGNNTAFTTEVTPGDILVLGAEKREHSVASVTNATSLTLDQRYTGNTITINGPRSSGITRRWEFYGWTDRAPGTSTYVGTQGGVGDEMHIVVADEDGQWTGQANTVLEVFEKVSKASDAKGETGETRYYKDVINQQSNYIRWAAHPSGLDAGTAALGNAFGAPSTVTTNSLVGGNDGATAGNDDYIRGYDLFKSSEDVDVSFILGGQCNQTRSVHIINQICEKRKDCIAVLSTTRGSVVNNEGDEADDTVTFRNTLPSTSYAVLDSGYKYQFDKYNDVYRYVPLNGDTAGLMVRTDVTRDPWYSPAGYNRGHIKNVIKLAYNPSQADRDILYKNGINPVVTFPGQGTILFGDKTLLAKPSAFDRINVRRLFIVLEKAISVAAKYTLFEFNDEFTRAQFRNLVEPFLRDVQGRRGIYDFKVVCDETNNTPEVIDRNEFVGDIYIKPARSINFIQLNFIAVRTGVDFEEIVGRF